METLFLVCFGVGLVLSLLAVAGGTGHLHIGHLRIGHIHAHKGGGHGLLHALNGFTLPAFLCWFGGAGYLMLRAGIWSVLVILLFALISGMAGASLVYALLFKVLMPRERILSREDTEMTGVVARVSDQIRPGGTGEILFSQMGTRRHAAARSEDGLPIPRDAEVVVLRYERGIAYVRTWDIAHPGDAFYQPERTALHD
jgi:membrane protein implicated in regulation of membrane protease activity